MKERKCIFDDAKELTGSGDVDTELWHWEHTNDIIQSTYGTCCTACTVHAVLLIFIHIIGIKSLL